MKRIEFVAPVEAMRGNLSGAQTLKYAENNNPAYEAPNGQQYAKNYATRYIGAKRAGDGLKYFAVKQKSSTTLNGLTRTQMGLIAVIAALKSSAGVNLVQLRAIWQSLKDAAGDAAPDYLKTFNKFFDYHMRRMLLYKETSHTIAGPGGSVTIQNPYKLENVNAAVIRADLWVKYAPLFAFGADSNCGVHFYIDGNQFFAPNSMAGVAPFNDFTALGNPNNVAALNGITIVEVGGDDIVQYSGQPVYNAGVLVKGVTTPEANAKYTTIPPME